MRVMTAVLILILTLAASTGETSAANDDFPTTFAGCVISGGQVRVVSGEMRCRLVHSYDFRVYGTAQSECGEELPVEIWGETRQGVLTFPLAPGRTVMLPEVGMPDGAIFATPLPCQDH